MIILLCFSGKGDAIGGQLNARGTKTIRRLASIVAGQG
jgi:hypothetical protein